MQSKGGFAERWVHLDLKGAPPRLSYLNALLPHLKSWGCTGLLIEFEDMFPYSGDLSVLQNPDAYAKEELREFLTHAHDMDFKIVPLIQTFGHLEFVLKHESMCHLREVPEYPNSICPSYPETLKVLCAMIEQVVQLCPPMEYFHIGCDEVFFISRCAACVQRKVPKETLFLEHVRNVAKAVRDQHGLKAIIWDDMLRGVTPAQIEESGLDQLVEVMVWEYHDLNKVPPNHMALLASAFQGVWFASAFKGATSSCQTVTPTGFHVENHFQWLSVRDAFAHEVKGLALTGWSRFDHYAVLCDLLPVALPTLAICLSMATEGCFTKEMHEKLSKELGFPDLIPWHPFDESLPLDGFLKFPGWEFYQGAHILLRLDKESEATVRGDLRRTWLSRRHVRLGQASPAMAEQLVETANGFLTRFQYLEVGFRRCMAEMFFDKTVEEWLDTHFAPRKEELQDLASDAEHLTAIGASVVMSH